MVDAAHLFASAAEANLTPDGQLSPELIAAFTKAFDNAHRRDFEANIFIKKKTYVSIDCYLTDADGIIIFDSSTSGWARTSPSSMTSTKRNKASTEPAQPESMKTISLHP